MRVLVAEDERITRATLVRQLESWGHSVTATEDGAAAWAAFEKEVFDLVLTDWEMPGLSGVELIGKIRASARPGYVYVILLTGRSNTVDIVSGIEGGADDYMPKPFDKDELRVRLLSGERVIRLERALAEQNAALRAADARMKHDLKAAARVQRAMLPRGVVETDRAKTAWRYVPTDVLAGDAVGLELVEGRYVVSYVLDVSGHGVPAALLAVTAMHQLSPSSAGMERLRKTLDEQAVGEGVLTSPLVTDLNRRLSAADNDGRFLTMVLSVLDTHTGRMSFTRAAHPLPLLIRDGACVPVDEKGGMPLAVFESAEYEDVHVQLRPGDRMVFYSDGVTEQLDPTQRVQYGDERWSSVLAAGYRTPGNEMITDAVDALNRWAGGTTFADDVSILCVDWLG